MSKTQTKIINFHNALTTSLIERDEEATCILVALLCKQHCLLVGGAGEAKTLLAHRVTEFLSGSECFEAQINKFTEPDELFGMFSLNAMKEDRYERLTDLMLPNADVAYLDEVFNGSSAILNTLLSIMNERRFRNGKEWVDCPLKLLIGTSNKYPNGEGTKELKAMFDRFLLRRTVRPIQRRANVSRLLWGDVSLEITEKLSQSELEEAQKSVFAMEWDEDAKSAYETIIFESRRSGIHPSGRRLRQCVSAVSAYAYLSGLPEVTQDSLGILADCLWVDPAEDQKRELSSIITKIASPSDLVCNSLMLEVDQIVDAIDTSDVAATSGSIKKLENIGKKLRKLGSARSERCCKEIEEAISKIKVSAFSSSF
jgi:MoxR-like ATPase